MRERPHGGRIEEMSAGADAERKLSNSKRGRDGDSHWMREKEGTGDWCM